MTDWIIERGNPIPGFRRDPKQAQALREAFEGLAIRDELFTRTIDARSVTNAYQRVAWNGKKFVSRTMDGGVRVWRVK